MSSDLINFLLSRLDDDERIARAATDGPWRVDNEGHAEAIYDPENGTVVGGGRWGGEAPVFDTTEDAIHIARHDPARVLQEVEAKRWIANAAEKLPALTEKYDLFDNNRDAWANTLRKLAAVYSDHPDYRQEWRP